MISLYVAAPFAAFRSFTAGYYRPTAGFMTYSAAYGLLLNLAGIEMRDPDDASPMTKIKTSGLPQCRIALGTTIPPVVQSVYQQLHNYPVGASGKDGVVRTKGSKYNIVPVRREFLCGLQAQVLAQGSEQFEQAVTDGIAGKRTGRYGLPFLGDNAFLPDKLELRGPSHTTRWWRRVREEDANDKLLANVTRLTITIDRENMALSKSALFRLDEETGGNPPEDAWEEIHY